LVKFIDNHELISNPMNQSPGSCLLQQLIRFIQKMIF